MTSRLRLRLRRLNQLDKMPLAYPKRDFAAGYLHPRHAVVIDPYHLSGHDDGIADLRCVRVSRGFLSHTRYLAHNSGAAR